MLVANGSTTMTAVLRVGAPLPGTGRVIAIGSSGALQGSERVVVPPGATEVAFPVTVLKSSLDKAALTAHYAGAAVQTPPAKISIVDPKPAVEEA